MSNDMKCPFCQQELEERHAATTDYNSMFITYYCGNPECESTTDLIGCKEFWDILGQHRRTRKALDVARNGLEYIFGYEGVPKYVAKHIRQVLDQIKNETALEQKD